MKYAAAAFGAMPWWYYLMAAAGGLCLSFLAFGFGRKED